jgi:hypothetical protein
MTAETPQTPQTRTFSGKHTLATFYGWLNPDLPHAEHFSRARLLSDFVECDEKTYWEFLEMLPPMHFERNHFAICEATTNDVRLGFFRVGDCYYAAHISDDDNANGIDAVHAVIAKQSATSHLVRQVPE